MPKSNDQKILHCLTQNKQSKKLNYEPLVNLRRKKYHLRKWARNQQSKIMTKSPMTDDHFLEKSISHAKNQTIQNKWPILTTGDKRLATSDEKLWPLKICAQKQRSKIMTTSFRRSRKLPQNGRPKIMNSWPLPYYDKLLFKYWCLMDFSPKLTT